MCSSGIVWGGKVGGVELLSASRHIHTLGISTWEALRSSALEAQLVKEFFCTNIGNVASVGNGTAKHTTHYVVRGLKNQGIYCFFVFFWGGAVAANGGRVRSFVQGGEPLLRTRGTIGSRSSDVYGKAPKRELHSNPIAISESGHTEQQINPFDAVIHTQESPPHKRFLVYTGRMQLILHATRQTPYGASRLVLAISAWSLKTRRASSRHSL